MGAVDYVPVPVVPEVLRAKIKVFAELYRKTRQLERLNAELEDRVRARTAELEKSHERLLESEQRRSLALAAGKMGSWDWDWINGDWLWDEGQYRIFGVDPADLRGDAGQRRRRCSIPRISTSCARRWPISTRARDPMKPSSASGGPTAKSAGASARRPRPLDEDGRVVRVSGVTIDITERKHAEERQNLLTREVDHRAKNALALAQSIVRLTRADNVEDLCQCRRRAASTRWRACIPILSLSSWQGAEIEQAGERGACALFDGRPHPSERHRRCSCSRPPRRRWRWRCTSSSPTRRNMARCRRCPDSCRSTGRSTTRRWR